MINKRTLNVCLLFVLVASLSMSWCFAGESEARQESDSMKGKNEQAETTSEESESRTEDSTEGSNSENEDDSVPEEDAEPAEIDKFVNIEMKLKSIENSIGLSNERISNETSQAIEDSQKTRIPILIEWISFAIAVLVLLFLIGFSYYFWVMKMRMEDEIKRLKRRLDDGFKNLGETNSSYSSTENDKMKRIDAKVDKVNRGVESIAQFIIDELGALKKNSRAVQNNAQTTTARSIQVTPSDKIIADYNSVLLNKIRRTDFYTEYQVEDRILLRIDAKTNREVQLIQNNQGQIIVYSGAFSNNEKSVAFIEPKEISTLGNEISVFRSIFEFEGERSPGGKVKCIRPANVHYNRSSNEYKLINKGIYVFH